jgi:phosphatidylglycerol:prolipoprotein diacylglycerol transferase
MLVIAFSLGSWLASQEAKKSRINPEEIFNFLFMVFVSGIIGARIFYVIENMGYYFKNPLEIIMLQYGGLAWFGGLIVGSVSGFFYLRKKKLGVYRILDLVAPFIALGQALGRVGCLLNGCCFGKASYYGVYLEAHNAVLLPTQIYSAGLLLIIFIILRLLQDRPRHAGTIFFAYLFLYSIKRFFIEFLRADNPIIYSGLTLFQILSILLFCVSSVKLILI